MSFGKCHLLYVEVLYENLGVICFFYIEVPFVVKQPLYYLNCWLAEAVQHGLMNFVSTLTKRSVLANYSNRRCWKERINWVMYNITYHNALNMTWTRIYWSHGANITKLMKKADHHKDTRFNNHSSRHSRSLLCWLYKVCC